MVDRLMLLTRKTWGHLPAAFALGLCLTLWADAGKAEPQGGEAKEIAPVMLGEQRLLEFSIPLRDTTPRQRAANAQQELEAAVLAGHPPEVKQRTVDGEIAILLDDRQVFTLTRDDASAAGQESLGTYADSVSTRLKEGIAAEQRRANIAKRVFSASLVVFFALIAMLLVRRIGELGARACKWAEERGDVLTLRILQFELLRSEMVQSAAVVGITVAAWVARIGVVYAWLAVALSLFEETRGYTGKLASFVLAPISELASRLASTLPVLVVACVAAIATWIVVRFIDLLFASVARRETQLAWVPPELALPTSVLLRLAVVVGALAFAAPTVTGDPNGALARTGMLALFAFGLSSVPILASALVGAAHLFGRRVPLGVYVEVGGRRGKLLQMTFLELRMLAQNGDEVRVPSLCLVRSPLVVLGRAPASRVTLMLETQEPTAALTSRLVDIADQVGAHPSATLVALRGDVREFHVQARIDGDGASDKLLRSLVEALQQAGVRVVEGHSESGCHV